MQKKGEREGGGKDKRIEEGTIKIFDRDSLQLRCFCMCNISVSFLRK